MLMTRITLTAGALGAALAGCTVTTTDIVEPTAAPSAAPSQVAVIDPASLDPSNPIEDRSGLGNQGDPELIFLGGYRSTNDPCQRVGETRFTKRHMTADSDLVACIRGGGAERAVFNSGARAVTQTPSYTFFRVPKGSSA